MKIIMAPVNFSGQPIGLVKELRKRGVDAQLIQYRLFPNTNRFGFIGDGDIDLIEHASRTERQIEAIERCLNEGVDLFHFWFRSMMYHPPTTAYNGYAGLDIPLIKQHGRKVVYRFTGNDLRLRSEHMKKNPYNFYRYGFESGINEDVQRMYLDFLREHVDQFIVQDPELGEFCPEAKTVPRVIDLEDWPFMGAINKDRPVVVHAPSKPMLKGTDFVRQAVEQLQSENLSFEYREIQGMKHEDAVQEYKRADIIIDQLYIGWYGVLALEAMALGKAVLTYVREDLYDAFLPRIPIINCNPDSITDRLREAIGDYDRRVELGRQARQFAEEVHDVKKVTATLMDVYQEVLDRPAMDLATRPVMSATLRYYAHQFTPKPVERTKPKPTPTAPPAKPKVNIEQRRTTSFKSRIKWAIHLVRRALSPWKRRVNGLLANWASSVRR